MPETLGVLLTKVELIVMRRHLPKDFVPTAAGGRCPGRRRGVRWGMVLLGVLPKLCIGTQGSYPPTGPFCSSVCIFHNLP